MNEIAWQEWQERFDYWKKFSVDHHGYIIQCPDWWLSRFNDDHPHLLGWQPEILWSQCIAPALDVYVPTMQLRFL